MILPIDEGKIIQFLVKALSWTSKESFQLHSCFSALLRRLSEYSKISFAADTFWKSFDLMPVCINSIASFRMSWAGFIWLSTSSIFFIFLPGIVFGSRCFCWCACQIFTFFFKTRLYYCKKQDFLSNNLRFEIESRSQKTANHTKSEWLPLPTETKDLCKNCHYRFKKFNFNQQKFVSNDAQ